jgi:signal recognition particle receptor subunit beta
MNIGENKRKDILPLAEEVLENINAVKEYCGHEAMEAEKLIEKLKDDEITVAVIGQFKRGKSCLSNVILEDNIMPVGIIPVTSVMTSVRYGDRKAEILFENGRVDEIGFDRLEDYISEQKNPDNKLRVKEVKLSTPSEFLKEGLTYVDTPGVGSFHQKNSEIAYDNMKKADAVIFLLSVDSPINQIEIEFLKDTREYAGKFYFAVNKVDTVAEEDLKAYTDYCRTLIGEILGETDIKLYRVSAVTGEGVEDLKQAILDDCESSIQEIMRESVRKKMIDLSNRTLDELEFFWEAMRKSYENLDESFDALKEWIEEKRVEAKKKDNMFEVRLNELKLSLNEKVSELFGLDYGYRIEETREPVSFMTKESYEKCVDRICDEPVETLSRILLYREENAYTVVRRIEDINKASRHLRSLLARLERI